MLVIDDGATLARALNSLDPTLRSLLAHRLDQLLADTEGDYDISELVRFVVVQVDDDIETIETAAGYAVVRSPAFEWVTDHGHTLEAAVVLEDTGFGVVILAPVAEGICPPLLSLLRSLAVPAHSKVPKRT